MTNYTPSEKFGTSSTQYLDSPMILKSVSAHHWSAKPIFSDCLETYVKDSMGAHLTHERESCGRIMITETTAEIDLLFVPHHVHIGLHVGCPFLV